MRARAAPFLVPLLTACGASGESLGTAEEPIKVCAGSTVLQGVDIYHGDGTINWGQVKSSGRSFAFAKATEGTTFTDSAFSANWAGMKQAGIVRSAYHFFHSNADPIAQADHLLAVMGTLQPGDLPPTLDLEVTDGQSAATITSTTIAWLDHVAAATGMKPILYTSPSFVTGSMGSPAGLETHAQLWVANWGVTCPDVPAPFTTWKFWQYSSTGTVPGIAAGAVDLDQFDGDLTALMGLTKGGSTSGSSSSSTSGSSSSSSGAPPPSCTANGVAGICIDVTLCASMPGHMSTAGLCPGPSTEECCTPTGTAASSSSSGTSTGTASGASSGTAASSSAGTGASGTASGSSGGAGTASGSSGAGTASGSSGAGTAGTGGVAASGAGGSPTTGTGGSHNVSTGCSSAPAGKDRGAAGGIFMALALAAWARRPGRKARAR